MSVLLGWVWQGTALALAVAVALRLAPRVGASARHAIWWLTLLTVLALPLASTWPAPDPASGTAPPPSSDTVRLKPDPAPAKAAVESLLLPAPPDWVVAVLLGAWLGTVVVGLARIGRGLDLLRSLRAGTSPIGADREDRLAHWLQARASGRHCTLRTSDHVDGACALGLWRPLIVVSRDFLAALDDDELDQVVMHEHAHLARYDDWTRLAQATVEAFAGLHPAIALIGRQIDIEREAACDDRVIARTGAPSRYAACLATVGAAALGQRADRAPAFLPSMARPSGTLLRRVARLLDPRRGHGLTLNPATAVVTVAALFAALASSRHAGPMVEVVEMDEAVALVSPAGPRPALPAYLPGVPSVLVPAVVVPAAAAADPPAVPQGQAPAVGAPGRVPSGETAASAQQPGHPSSGLAAIETTGWQPASTPAVLPAIALPAPPAPLAETERGPWTALASTGTSIGTGSKKAGVAVAGFFGRAAKATASSF